MDVIYAPYLTQFGAKEPLMATLDATKINQPLNLSLSKGYDSD